MQELLALIEVADLDRVDLATLLEVVQFAQDGCAAQDPRFGWLLSIEEALLDGTIPVQSLRDFALRFPLTLRPEAVELEEEFTQLALQLGEADWTSAQYVELVAAVEELDDEALRHYVLTRRLAVRQAQEGYIATALSPDEVTAETYVAHRLLCQGMELWMQALERLLHDPEGDWEPALADAEHGTRLLVAVQKLHQRVAAAAGM